jgi:branched-subunit amino acid aminotransferase/4-amino-4-deoxychorismate lyase
MTTVEIIRPGQSVELAINEPALAHGYGVFETIRVEASTVQFWNAHWERLNASARYFGMTLSASEDSVLSAIRELVLGEDPEGAMNIKLSAMRTEVGARLWVYSRTPLPRPDKLNVLVGGGSAIDAQSLLAGHKTHNYMENRVLMERAAAAGCYDILRCNSEGYVAEGAISNVFWEKAGELYTPSEKTGLLPGVVRLALLDGLKVNVGFYPLEALMDADGLYLTNSSLGIQPVDSLLFGSERMPLAFQGAKLSSQIDTAYKAALHRTALRL